MSRNETNTARRLPPSETAGGKSSRYPASYKSPTSLPVGMSHIFTCVSRDPEARRDSPSPTAKAETFKPCPTNRCTGSTSAASSSHLTAINEEQPCSLFTATGQARGRASSCRCSDLGPRVGSQTRCVRPRAASTDSTNRRRSPSLFRNNNGRLLMLPSEQAAATRLEPRTHDPRRDPCRCGSRESKGAPSDDDDDVSTAGVLLLFFCGL
jgi:hypothetical protein